MKKLICENCFTENEIKNEQIVFCLKCHKKLALNFTDWKHQHPEPDFEAYTNEFEKHNSEVLRVSEQNQAQKIKLNSDKTFLRFAASIVLIIVVFLVCMQNQRNTLFDPHYLRNNTTCIHETQWENYSIGDSLSITLPFSLKYCPTVISPFLAEYTHSITSRRAECSQSFSVTIEEYELSPYFATNHHDFYNLQDEYVLESNAAVYQVSENEILKMKNYDVDLTHNTFVANNNKYLSDNYTLIRGKTGIKIIVTYLKNDPLLNKYADIVNESIYKNA